MSKRLIAMLVGSFAVVVGIVWVLLPHTFEDCVLAHVKPGLSDQATGAVYEACRAKFPVSTTATGASRSPTSGSSFDWEKFWGNSEASPGARARQISPRWDRLLALVLAPVMLLWAVLAKVAQVAGLRARWSGWLASFLLTWAGAAAAVRVLGDTNETFVAAPFLLSAATLGLLALMTKRSVAASVRKTPDASLDASKADAPE